MQRDTAAAVVRDLAATLDQVPTEQQQQTRDEVLAQFAPKKKSAETSTGLPDYVVHDDATPHIGRLASEAVIKSWELAAQDLEQMGVQFQIRVDEVNRHLAEAAASIRARGTECFKSIESAVTLADLVSRQCAEIRNRLALEDINKGVKP